MGDEVTRAAELAAALDRLCFDDDAWHQLRERGFARAENFSWDAAARQTIDIYRSAIDEVPIRAAGVKQRPA